MSLWAWSRGRKALEELGSRLRHERHRPEPGGQKEFIITIKAVTLAVDRGSDGSGGHDGDGGAGFILNHGSTQAGFRHAKTVGLLSADQFVLERSRPEL